MNRRSVAVLVVAAALVLAGCTGSNDKRDKGSGHHPSATTPASHATTGPFRLPGKYAYQRAGIAASLSIGDSPTLTFTNRSGKDLSAPGIYFLRADTGERVDVAVEGTQPVPNGASKTFTVDLDPSITPTDIGLIALLVGDADFGAFQPPLPSVTA